MRQLVYEKENSEFKPVKLRFKIDLVSYPARAEGLVNMVAFKIFWFYIFLHEFLLFVVVILDDVFIKIVIRNGHKEAISNTI